MLGLNQRPLPCESKKAVFHKDVILGWCPRLAHSTWEPLWGRRARKQGGGKAHNVGGLCSCLAAQSACARSALLARAGDVYSEKSFIRSKKSWELKEPCFAYHKTRCSFLFDTLVLSLNVNSHQSFLQVLQISDSSLNPNSIY